MKQIRFSKIFGPSDFDKIKHLVEGPDSKVSGMARISKTKPESTNKIDNQDQS